MSDAIFKQTTKRSSYLKVAEAVGYELLLALLREFCDKGGSAMICSNQAGAWPLAKVYRMINGKLESV